MTKNNQIKIIKIYKDPKMFYSEWAIFGISILLMFVFLFNMITIINNFTNESNRVISLIVFLFIFAKISVWVRVPVQYGTTELVEDIKLGHVEVE